MVVRCCDLCCCPRQDGISVSYRRLVCSGTTINYSCIPAHADRTRPCPAYTLVTRTVRRAHASHACPSAKAFTRA